MGIYLVTGCLGGMGSALCRKLLEEGHRVFGIDRAGKNETDGVTLLSADITDEESVRQAFHEIREKAGRLDGIIHMAGVYDLNSLVEMPEEDFVRDFNVNLFGMFRVNRQFLPLLSEGGRIVIISSELAPLYPLPFTGIYAVTKTAVEQYARALRMELQLLNHPVTVVRPGAVDTGMLPVSTEKLERFSEKTRLYSFGAARFRKIVNAVESRSVPPEKIAGIVSRALKARHPRRTVNVNRNPLLLLYGVLPEKLKLFAIRKILS